MSKYSHYRNSGEAGSAIFATTTCLDFAHLFMREEMRERMAYELCRTHERYGAVLHAFVVMTHHIHFISKMPENHDPRWFVQRLKSSSAHNLLPYLNERERLSLGHQVGLNQRKFWQRSYRSIVLTNTSTLRQKVTYIHGNPVRAELTATPEEYRWSSASMYVNGQYDEELGLQIPSGYWKTFRG